MFRETESVYSLKQVSDIDYSVLYQNHSTTQAFRLEYEYGNWEECEFTNQRTILVTGSDDDGVTIVTLDSNMNPVSWD